MDLQYDELSLLTPDELARLGTDRSPVEEVQANESGEPQELSTKYSDEDGSLIYVGDKIKTVDELLAYAQVDLSIWEVVESRINRWEVGGKKRNGQAANGKWLPETLWKTPLLQISVKLKRKLPKGIHDAIKEILAEVPVWRGQLPQVAHRNSTSDRHLLELSVYDTHLGKLSYAPCTGDNYDLNIASADYLGAVEDMLNRVGGFNIERIVIPVGHDFFQVDNWVGTTHRGTVVDSTDDRFTKVYRRGYDIIQQMIMRCREVAPVEIIWVPGNHDTTTSWYLCEQLRAVHESDPHVTVDNTPKKRKYRLYGITLIGYDHGETVSMTDLPGLFMAEAAELLSQSVYRTWRIGHRHKKKKIKWIENDTFAGVDVTILPSLSATDEWHYNNGFVGNHRTAEACLWSRTSGPAGSFPVEARSAIEKRTKKHIDEASLFQVI